MSVHALALVVLILLVAKTGVALGMPRDKTKKVEWTPERVILAVAAILTDVFLVWLIVETL